MSDKINESTSEKSKSDGGRKSTVTDEQRVHDFLDFLDPIHETPRRILSHLASSISSNDIGATAFCLRALFEGMANLFMAREIGEQRILEWIPDEGDAKSYATSQMLNWLLLQNSQSPRSVAIHWSSPPQLIVRIEPSQLEILQNESDSSFVRPRNFDVAIKCFGGGGKNRFRFQKLKSAYSNANNNSDFSLLPEKIPLISAPLYVQILLTQKKARPIPVLGQEHAEAWFFEKKANLAPLQMISKDFEVLIEKLSIDAEKKHQANALLHKLYDARNAYVHDFGRLPYLKTEVGLNTIEYFDVFEPVFHAMKDHYESHLEKIEAEKE